MPQWQMGMGCFFSHGWKLMPCVESHENSWHVTVVTKQSEVNCHPRLSEVEMLGPEVEGCCLQSPHRLQITHTALGHRTPSIVTLSKL